MAKCSQCLHWDVCSMLFEIVVGRKPTANRSKAEEKCPHFKDKTINTNADRIRAMSDEELLTMRPEQREVLSSSIREMLSIEEMMAQLAEEAAELGHAALKLRRVRDGRNYTPVTFQEAYDRLKEEISDVLLCLEVLGVDGDRKAMDAKLERWVGRLKERGGADHV